MPVNLSWDDSVLKFDKQFEVYGMLLRTAELSVLCAVFPLFPFLAREAISCSLICAAENL